MQRHNCALISQSSVLNSTAGLKTRAVSPAQQSEKCNLSTEIKHLQILKYCSSPKTSLFVGKTRWDATAGFSTRFTAHKKQCPQSAVTASPGDLISCFAPSQGVPQTFDIKPLSSLNCQKADRLFIPEDPSMTWLEDRITSRMRLNGTPSTTYTFHPSDALLMLNCSRGKLPNFIEHLNIQPHLCSLTARY